jgi:hypothetical protein
MENVSSSSNLAAVRRIANPIQAAHRTVTPHPIFYLIAETFLRLPKMVLKIVVVDSGFGDATYTILPQSGRSPIASPAGRSDTNADSNLALAPLG